MKLQKGDFVCHIEQTHQPTIWEVLDGEPVLDETYGEMYSVLPILYEPPKDQPRVLVEVEKVRFATWEELAAEIDRHGFEVCIDSGVLSYLVVKKEKWNFVEKVYRQRHDVYKALFYDTIDAKHSELDLRVLTKEVNEANALVPLLNRFLEFRKRVAKVAQNT